MLKLDYGKESSEKGMRITPTSLQWESCQGIEDYELEVSTTLHFTRRARFAFWIIEPAFSIE